MGPPTMSEVYKCPQCINPETGKNQELKWIDLGKIALCTSCDTSFIPRNDGKWLADREPIIEQQLPQP